RSAGTRLARGWPAAALAGRGAAWLRRSPRAVGGRLPGPGATRPPPRGAGLRLPGWRQLLAVASPSPPVGQPFGPSRPGIRPRLLVLRRSVPSGSGSTDVGSDQVRYLVCPAERVGGQQADPELAEEAGQDLSFGLAQLLVVPAADGDRWREVAERREAVGVVGVPYQLPESGLVVEPSQAGGAALDDEQLPDAGR